MSKEITLEKLAKIPAIIQLRTNKEKDKIGFYWNKTERYEFYTLDPKIKEYKKITDGELPRAIREGYVWLKDKKHIIYTRDKDGDEQHNLFLFNIETKESIQLSETPEAQDIPHNISPDGSYLCFGSTRAGQFNLFKMNIETKEVVQLTEHKAPTWFGAVWNKDKWIYYSCNETKNLKNLDIWAVKEDGSEKKLVLHVTDVSKDFIADASDDGMILAIESNAKGVKQAGILVTETNEVKWFGDAKYDEKVVELSKDAKTLLVLRNREAEIIPVIYNIETGEGKELDFKGVVFDVSYCLDAKYLVYTRSDLKTPQILALYDIENAKEEIIIPPQTDLTEEDFYDSEYVKHPSFDDLKIPAVLYKPKIEEGKKYPALVLVHGGPDWQFFRDFSMFGQVFAHNGFVLLQPNVRGSTGYGKEFLEMNYLDWGGGDAQDVIYGKKFLENLDYVDPERIGVFGGSYGGFMTFIQMTKYADAGWKAGSAWIGISNLKTFFDLSKPHFKYFIMRHLGTYEEQKELWEDRSAINHVEKIQAPIQMIHGANDPRCNVIESRQFRDKLVEMGKKEGEDYEYVEFADEGHGAYSDMNMRVRTFKLFLDFFKRRL
ncbi:MAG: prolyl oligopeptidase family serine peptidase [Asgard group archaeon]